MRNDIEIRLGTAAEVIDLRHAILRAGLPRETAMFAGDDDATSRHVVATLDGRVVGCATVHFNSFDNLPAFQVRGMATDPLIRGSGIGRSMLKVLEEMLIAQSPVRRMWCHARVPAIGFYEKLGWCVVSEVFNIHDAGPHVKMTKILA